MNGTNSTTTIPGGKCTCSCYTNGYTDPTYLQFMDITAYITYVAHLFCLFGVFGNILSLIAFAKQLKISQGNYFQISVIVSDILAIIANVLAEGGYVYLGVWDQKAPDIIQKSYLLAVFAKAYSLRSQLSMSVLILMILIAGDRLFALYKPLVYKDFNLKNRAVIFFVLAHLLGLALTFYRFFTPSIAWVKELDIYVLEYSDQHWIFGYIAYGRFILSSVLIVVLFLLVIAMLYMYHKLMEKRKLMHQASTAAGVSDSGPTDDKTLTKLSLAQCSLILLGSTSQTSYRMILSMMGVLWCTPIGFVADLFRTVFLSVQFASNFIIYIGVSKTFRKSVVAALFCRDMRSPSAGFSSKMSTVMPSTVGKHS